MAWKKQWQNLMAEFYLSENIFEIENRAEFSGISYFASHVYKDTNLLILARDINESENIYNDILALESSSESTQRRV